MLPKCSDLTDIRPLIELHEKTSQGEWRTSIANIMRPLPDEAPLMHHVADFWPGGDGLIPEEVLANARFCAMVHQSFPAIAKELTQIQSVARSLEQATNCARCGNYKHTPWRAHDGYICAGCMGKENADLKAKLRRLRAFAEEQIVMSKKDQAELYAKGDEESIRPHVRACTRENLMGEFLELFDSQDVEGQDEDDD